MEEFIQQDLRVEEYKTLRAEIMHHMEAQEKNIIASITACGVALTFGLTQHFPFVFLLAAGIAAYFWVQHINHRIGIARTAAYISVFLEGLDTGLGWETRLRETHLKDTGESKFRPPVWIRRFILPYPVLIITSFGAIFYEVRTKYFSESNILSQLILLIPFFLVFYYIIKSASKSDHPYSELVFSWRNAFMQLKKDELNFESTDGHLLLKAEKLKLKTTQITD